MTAHDVLAACYGIGAIYPVVILDENPNWVRPPHRGIPEPASPTTDDTPAMLALRWIGTTAHQAAAPDLLQTAFDRAPAPTIQPRELAAFHRSLPPSLRLITLVRQHVIGPWSERPGRLSTRTTQLSARQP
ncbi:hypothetical protein [Streptomyces venezuelae]|uniref:hypothetical protein n=1 Tax=Streptomyces venezuelae TaxID=54571 RepID=UPI003425487F